MCIANLIFFVLSYMNKHLFRRFWHLLFLSWISGLKEIQVTFFCFITFLFILDDGNINYILRFRQSSFWLCVDFKCCVLVIRVNSMAISPHSCQYISLSTWFQGTGAFQILLSKRLCAEVIICIWYWNSGQRAVLRASCVLFFIKATN